jgi:hypothetical protein
LWTRRDKRHCCEIDKSAVLGKAADDRHLAQPATIPAFRLFVIDVSTGFLIASLLSLVIGFPLDLVI